MNFVALLTMQKIALIFVFIFDINLWALLGCWTRFSDLLQKERYQRGNKVISAIFLTFKRITLEFTSWIMNFSIIFLIAFHDDTFVVKTRCYGSARLKIAKWCDSSLNYYLTIVLLNHSYDHTKHFCPVCLSKFGLRKSLMVNRFRCHYYSKYGNILSEISK